MAKKLFSDEEFELTEPEEKIYKKGHTEGFREGAYTLLIILWLSYIIVEMAT